MADDPWEYEKAHRALVKERGRAQDHTCSSCGGTAFDWALQPGSTSLVTDGQGRVYSTDPDDYAPMCRPCHSKLDGKDAGLMAWYAADPERERQTRSSAGKKGIAAAAPKLTEHRQSIAKVNHTAKRRCLECGFESVRTGLGRHQQASGHTGWEDVQ